MENPAEGPKVYVVGDEAKARRALESLPEAVRALFESPAVQVQYVGYRELDEIRVSIERGSIGHSNVPILFLEMGSLEGYLGAHKKREWVYTTRSARHTL